MTPTQRHRMWRRRRAMVQARRKPLIYVEDGVRYQLWETLPGWITSERLDT